MKRIITAALIAPLAIGLAACDVDQTKKVKLPEVDVKGGQLPAYDVQPAQVDVKTKKTTVEVPDVTIRQPDAKGTPVTGKE